MVLVVFGPDQGISPVEWMTGCCEDEQRVDWVEVSRASAFATGFASDSMPMVDRNFDMVMALEAKVDWQAECESISVTNLVLEVEHHLSFEY